MLDPPRLMVDSQPQSRFPGVGRRFWSIAKLYWVGDQRWQAHTLLLFLVVLLLGRTSFTLKFTEQSGELTSALAAHDAARFWRSMRSFALALALGVPVYALYYFLRDSLGMAWRSWLTGHYLQAYFRHRAYYRLAVDQVIDNPDQRIAEDVGAFSQKSLKVLVEVIGAAMQLLAFSGVLWSISERLVWILLGYAVSGTVVSVLVFGKPLVALTFQQLRREADFRFSLIRAREHAEAIAFYAGEEPEQRHILTRFGALYANFSALLRKTLKLNLFQYAFTFATYAIPGIVLAPRLLAGELEVGRLVLASGAFASLLEALSICVDNFEMLTGFAAGINRLHDFGRALALGPPLPDNRCIVMKSGGHVELQQLTLTTPDSARTLVRDLSLRVEPGANLLIVGPSGCGKSSLLRAIAGLWQNGSGTVLKPVQGEILFLPQRPYMVLGSLRAQLIYPSASRDIADAELREVLAQVNLADLADRYGGLDMEQDFAKLLSVGEQQRLAIARALLHRPKYAVLDEATSALDPANEQALHELLRRSHTTLISVAHRPDLAAYHVRVLQLVGDGTWHLSSLGPSSAGLGVVIAASDAERLTGARS